jgi:hypothetical protein
MILAFGVNEVLAIHVCMERMCSLNDTTKLRFGERPVLEVDCLTHVAHVGSPELFYINALQCRPDVPRFSKQLAVSLQAH